MLWTMLAGRKTPKSPVRIYAIGDIHGRGDLFAELIQMIEEDITGRAPMNTQLVVLGDFIDRGADSAQIIDVLMRLRQLPNIVVLRGNHEATMIDALEGDAVAVEAWFAHGGKATLASFGCELSDDAHWDLRTMMRRARAAVPRAVTDWMKTLPVSHRIGRYFFTHAGVRPGIPLGRQTADDLLWIRDEFTQSEKDHGAIVVHGHSIDETGVYIGTNRIGVDTGAYRTDRLSAVRLEGDAIQALTTRAIGISRRPDPASPWEPSAQ